MPSDPMYQVEERDETQYRSGASPEKQLLAAMIERARLDLEQPDPKVRRAAEKWILSESTSKFSFNWVLENLGYSCAAHQLRCECQEKLKNYRKRVSKRVYAKKN